MMKRERPFTAKNLLKFIALLVLVFPLALISCSSSGGDDDEDWGEDYDPESREICERVAKVANTVADYYTSAESIGELEQYLDEISQIQYVKDCYTTETTLFVEIEDYGRISYSYFPDYYETYIYDESSDILSKKAPTRALFRASGTNIFESHTFFNAQNVAIVNQLVNDEGRKGQCLDVANTKEMFDLFGYKAKEESPTIDFFKEGIYNYDIVFILTHGLYDSGTKLHWLFTSEYPNNNNSKQNGIFAKDLYESLQYPNDQVSFGMLTEKRNGRKSSYWYAKISEKFISESKKDFKTKAIVFNAACESMMGKSRKTKDSIDYSMGKAFTNRGAGVYFGYDREDRVGAKAGEYFFERLMAGMSVNESFNTLPFDIRHSFTKNSWLYRDFWADLIPCWANDNIKDYCITKPQIVSYNDLSTETETKWTFSASSKWYFDFISYENNETGPFIKKESEEYKDNFIYGFILSKSKDMSDPVLLLSKKMGSNDCIYSNYIVNYTQILDYKELESGTTYYIWPAFKCNGVIYHGDIQEFTTKAINFNGQGELPDVPGSDF